MLIRYVTVINWIFLLKADDDFTKLITEAGYPAEAHSVVTEDSYILNIYRIPSSKPTSKTVILMHGLLACGAQFLFTGPRLAKPLAFKLADNGYDVWIGNVRGTEFSRAHKHLQPSSETFWKFSWDEIAQYDLPAMIDCVLMKTNQTSLHYVGHSQGTTVVMAMLSALPQYNEKIKTLHLMAPAIYFSYAVPLVKGAAMFSDVIEDGVLAVGLVEWTNLSPQLQKLVAYFCSQKATIEVCKQIVFAFAGPSQHINEAIFTYQTATNVIRYFPSSASVLQDLHYAQLIRSGGDRFLHFNHRENNMLIYNQSTPPVYQLSNVRSKIHFLYGTTDYITTYQDSERLIKEFKPWTIGVTKLIGYNHLDFMIAKNVDQLVNTKILNLMNRYN